MGNGSETNKPDGRVEAIAERIKQPQSQIRSCSLYGEEKDNQVWEQIGPIATCGGSVQSNLEADQDTEPLVVVLCAPDSFHRTADEIRKMADAISQIGVVVLDAYNLPWIRERLGDIGKEFNHASIRQIEALLALLKEGSQPGHKRRTIHTRISHRGRFRAYNQKDKSLWSQKLQHIQLPFQRIRRKAPPCNRY